MKILFILFTLIYSSLAQTSINNTTDKNVNHYSSMMSITSGIEAFLFMLNVNMLNSFYRCQLWIYDYL